MMLSFSNGVVIMKIKFLLNSPFFTEVYTFAIPILKQDKHEYKEKDFYCQIK